MPPLDERAVDEARARERVVMQVGGEPKLGEALRNRSDYFRTGVTAAGLVRRAVGSAYSGATE